MARWVALSATVRIRMAAGKSEKMKHLRETFTDKEFEQLKQAKNLLGKNWHDLLLLFAEYANYIEYVESGDAKEADSFRGEN